jgi:hypothetical protein
MSNELIVSPTEVMMTPVGTVADFLHAYQLKKEIIEGILREGVDFGAVPGTDKPTLKKAGAEKMNNFYNLHPVFEDVKVTEDWTGADHSGEPFFYYRQKCNLYKEIGGQTVMVASADGSCNSWEKKYRYRNSERLCPHCGKATIIKGKAEYGGGWICFTKKGGCNAKFADNAPEIASQVIEQVKNPDVAEQTNTILKMAQKRALVAATLIATNTSDYFTQDMEDFVSGEVVEVANPEPPKANRPYDPGTLHAKLTERTAKNKGKVVTDVVRKVTAAALSKVFPDNTTRYEFTKWAFGEASTKNLLPEQILALQDWLMCPSFESTPDPTVMSEGHNAHSAALVEGGQMTLPEAK